MLKALFETHKATIPSVRPEEVDAYEAYFAILREWNAKINLVSRKSIDSSWQFHFVDSLYLCDFAQKHRGDRTLRDLGTGAGFPGVIFAIRYPQVRVQLYEKMAKRRLFLADLLKRLALRNVHLDGALPENRFVDLFTARAVFPPAELFPFMAARFKEDGRLVLSTGGSHEHPPSPGFRCLDKKEYELPLGAGPRKLGLYAPVPRGTK